MSRHSGDEAAGILLGIVFFVVLYVALVATILLIASIAVFIIGWYLTHQLIMYLDRVVEESLVAEHGGLLLILSGGLWALLAWLCVPASWLQLLTTTIPVVANYPYLLLTLGGILGLTWGMLALFVADREDEADLLDASGMYSLTDQALLAGEANATSLLTEGNILGTDIDS